MKLIYFFTDEGGLNSDLRIADSLLVLIRGLSSGGSRKRSSDSLFFICNRCCDRNFSDGKLSEKERSLTSFRCGVFVF